MSSRCQLCRVRPRVIGALHRGPAVVGLGLAVVTSTTLVACGGEPASQSSAAAGHDDSPVALDDPGLPDVTVAPVTPSLSVDEVGEALTRALAMPPNSTRAIESYRMLMGMGDDWCPGNEYYITDTHLYGCHAETGYFYAGVSDWIDEIVDPPTNANMVAVAGDFWIETPDGKLFEGGGAVVYITGDGFWAREMYGSWLWEGGDPWLASGFSGVLSIEVMEEYGIRVSGSAQIEGTSWSANELMLDNACDRGPSGQLGLRDPSGGWYTLDFTDCAPCATVQFEGAALGSTCVDFEPFIAAVEAME
jgi:hypothetical protein